MQRATELGRAILTLNRRDFAALHAVNTGHGGIVLLKIEADAVGQAQRIQTAVQTSGGLPGALIRVHKPSL